MIFDEAYFQGSSVAEPNPAGYDDYEATAYAIESAELRASMIIGIANAAGIQVNTILVLGCAYGYLVEAFRNVGVAAHGIDISEYAVNRAVIGGVWLGDASSEASYLDVEIGSGFGKFDVIVEENMLCCLTDKEAVSLCDLSRAKSSLVLHIVAETEHLSKYYNYHDIYDWKQIVGTFPGERWFTLFNWEEK